MNSNQPSPLEARRRVRTTFQSVSIRKDVPDDQFHEFCPGHAWTPPVNVYQDRENIYVIVDLAGVGTQAVELDYNEGKLTISGHRPTPPPPDVHGRLHVHHMEIDHGHFCRELAITEPINPEGIEAFYRTGQLLVTLPLVRR
jgi:HSP20 family molecular chaperone IbpA